MTRQTTLFGLPPKPPAEKKGKALKKGERSESRVNGIAASTSVQQVADVGMSEVPPPSEVATLVETQETATEDTQLSEDEVPIEWEASPPPSPR